MFESKLDNPNFLQFIDKGVVTFGRTGTISSSGITNDRSIVFMLMSATSDEVSNNSTEAVFPFLQKHFKEE